MADANAVRGRVFAADDLAAAAGIRLPGVTVVRGASFKLDDTGGHDLVADRVVTYAYGRSERVRWFVTDPSDQIHRRRLRAACSRAGGVAEILAAWQGCSRRVRVVDLPDEPDDVGSLANECRGAGLVVIESATLGAPAQRQALLEFIERIAPDADALVLDRSRRPMRSERGSGRNGRPEASRGAK